MKEAFIIRNFQAKSLARIDQCNSIVEEYQRIGLTLTVRQIYYQFVGRAFFANTARNYKNLASLITNAREAGLIDWEAIEDRTRPPYLPSEFAGLPQLISAAMSSYRLRRWETQTRHVELWTEKSALASVLMPISDEYHVPFIVNRGYTSASEMYKSAKRFIAESDGRAEFVILYLGDFDPSGEDMVRDVSDRLTMFRADRVDIRKLALTREQVETHDLPPDFTKTKDSRAAEFIEKHGDGSWEVDALGPEITAGLVRSTLESLVDRAALAPVLEREESDKARFLSAVQRLLPEAAE